MFETKRYRGHSLRIAVGITMLVLLMAQGVGATKYINDNTTGGECTSFGTWNAATKTCTMTIDLTDGIQIDSDGMTLDGNGRTITGSSYTTGYGIFTERNGVTIKNTDVRDFYYSIYLYSSSNSMLIGNNASSKHYYGIYLYYSSNNTLSGNTASDHAQGIYLYVSSNNMLNGNNVDSNSLDGIHLESSSNNVLSGNNASNNGGGIYLQYSSYNTIIGNNASKNGGGIYLGSESSNNMLSGNDANSNNYNGIGLFSSSNENTLTGNNANSNQNIGIYLESSSNNVLSGNNASSNNEGGGIVTYDSGNNVLNGNNASNNYNGIYMGLSSNNTLNGNNASNNENGIYLYYTSSNTLSGNNASNNENGINLYYSNNNTIYNNLFINNNYFESSDSVNKWNTAKISGTNIIGGPYFGGNFWAYPNGTGFSQTCIDSDSEGICDSPITLDSNNIDYLPLAYKPDISPTPTPTPLLVSAVTPNSRNARVGKSVTIFKTVINGGTGNATGVSIKQATGLPISVSYQQWNGVSFTGLPNTPVDMPAGGIANFVLTLIPTAEFSTSSVTFNVSGTNAAPAGISAVNTLTMSASTVAPSDVIMMSTNLNVQTAVGTATAFAVATSNVGASATGVNFNVVIPSSISGLVVQVNQTNPATGAIIGPATGLTINSGAQMTFAVFVTPTAAIASDPANNRITLQLVDGSGKVIGAQSVAVSTV